MKMINAFALVAVLSSAVMANATYGCETAACEASDKLVLSGQVVPFCKIKVNAEVAASQLNIVSGESSKKVASVSESTNNTAGYQVSVSSLNNGKLKNGASLISYQISYNGGSLISPTSSSSIVKTKSGPLAGAITEVSDVKVSFAANPSAAAGNYGDTLTFTLTAL